MKTNSVVVTGLGVATPIGLGIDPFWENLMRGASGVSPVSVIDTSDFDVRTGAEIKGFSNASGDRTTALAIRATHLALEDADIKPAEIYGANVAVIMGTSCGNQESVERINEATLQGHQPSSHDIRNLTDDNISVSVTKRYSLTGPSLVIPTACSSGNHAIALGYDLIRSGRTSLALVGGADSISRILFTVFNRLQSLSPDVCRPFDSRRQGIVIGEGAGVLVLEPLEWALTRRARIYAQVLGYGLACDISGPTAPGPEGAGVIEAIRRMSQTYDVDLSSIDYISAHGTGTQLNDTIEVTAMKKLFGHGFKIPMSSIKSMVGHTMGAASALEAAACCMAIKTGLVPPTINYGVPDPACDIDPVPNIARAHKVRVAISNAFAFGGSIGVVAFGEIR